jgi:hypothetical protein
VVLQRNMIARFYLIFFILLPFVSCSQNKMDWEKLKKSSFSTMQFEADGKPCFASIDNRFIEFDDKSTYSLSLFILVNTLEKDKNGHPTENESLLFNELQSKLLKELSSAIGNYCYVGTTTMSGYRDILLYIKPEHEKIATEILERFKKEQNRIDTLSFEDDPEWEAVSGFYNAIEIKN